VRGNDGVNRWRSAAAFVAFTCGAWWLAAAADQWRLWRTWQSADPSAAELYQTNALLAAAAAAVSLGAGVAAAWPRRADRAAGTGWRGRLVVLVGGALLGVALARGARWLAIDECLDSGGRWDRASLVCVRHR
jgi:hypothetical protein